MKEVNKQSSPTGISRREFLGMAATGAAALTILPSFTVAGLGHVAPSDKLYIANRLRRYVGAADWGSLMNTPHKNAAITFVCATWMTVNLSTLARPIQRRSILTIREM